MFRPTKNYLTLFSYFLFCSLTLFSTHHAMSNENEQLVLQNVLQNPWILNNPALRSLATIAHQNPSLKKSLQDDIAAIKKEMVEKQQKEKFGPYLLFTVGTALLSLNTTAITLGFTHCAPLHEPDESAFNFDFVRSAAVDIITLAGGAYFIKEGAYWLKEQQRLSSSIKQLTTLEDALMDSSADKQ